MAVCLLGIASAVAPELRPIETLKGEPATLERLARAGFRTFSSAPAGATTLLASAVGRCLERSGVAARQVDAVILATESFGALTAQGAGCEPVAERRAMIEALVSVGIRTAYVYGCWLTGCGNLLASLALAQSLVNSGYHQRVVVAAVDVCDAARRVMSNGAAVYSDAAAACVVQQHPEGTCFELRHLVLSADLQGASLERDKAPSAAALMLDYRGMRAATARAKAAFGRELKDYSLIIGPNLSDQALSAFADALAIDVAQIARPTRERLGHGNAADQLLTLEHWRDGGSLVDGTEILLLNPAPFAWNMAECVFRERRAR